MGVQIYVLKKYIENSMCFGAVLFLMFFFSACSGGNSEMMTDENIKVVEEPIVFRLAETMTDTYPATIATQYFAERVGEESEGRIRIKLYTEGVLGDEESVLEQVQFGGIAMARVTGDAFTEEVKSLWLYMNPESYESSDGLMESLQDDEELIAVECLKERYVPLIWFYPDLRCFYSDEEPLEKIDDLSGMKILVNNESLLELTLNKYGSEVVGNEGADIYKSMRSGFMDIGEASLGEVMNSEYYEFIEYMTISDYVSIPDVLIIGAAEYSVLSTKDRELLKICAYEAQIYYETLLNQLQTGWLDELDKDNKNVVRSPELDAIMGKISHGKEVDSHGF